MADFYPDFYDELRTKIKAIWTDITTDAQIFNDLQAASVNFVQWLANGVGTLPWCVIEIGNLTRDDDWSCVGEHKRAPVTVWYIAKPTGSNVDAQKAIHAKIYALGNAIDFPSTNFTTMLAVDRCTLDSSGSNRFNAFVAGDAKVPSIYGGCVSWIPGLLVGQ